MNLVVKGRGDRLPAHTRRRVERKLSRLSRLDPRIDVVEVEVTRQPSKRIDGGHRAEATCRAPRRIYRATGTGTDVDAAVERVLERLERQMVERHARRVARKPARPAGER